MKPLGPVYADEIEHFHSRYRIDKVLVLHYTNNVSVGIDRITHDSVIIKSAFNQGTPKLKEANLLRKLRNVTGVMDLLDHFHTQERVHLVITKNFGDMTLKRYLQEMNALTEDDARKLLLQVITTVQECARFNIFHFKLKTDNLMLDIHQWQVKLKNFDCATYIRPEGFKDKKRKLCFERAPPEYHSQSYFYWDTYTVWSIGTLLYEMLFSRPPFNCAYDIINTPCFKKPPHHLSRHAQWFIESCLKKKEEERIYWKHLIHHPWITNTF